MTSEPTSTTEVSSQPCSPTHHHPSDASRRNDEVEHNSDSGATASAISTASSESDDSISGLPHETEPFPLYSATCTIHATTISAPSVITSAAPAAQAPVSVPQYREDDDVDDEDDWVNPKGSGGHPTGGVLKPRPKPTGIKK